MSKWTPNHLQGGFGAPLWTSERASYRAAYSEERMEAVLFLPRNLKPPFQAVIHFPGAGTMASLISQNLQGICYLAPIIESGRVALHPIFHGTHERFDGIPNGRSPTRSGRLAGFATFFGLWSISKNEASPMWIGWLILG